MMTAGQRKGGTWGKFARKLIITCLFFRGKNNVEIVAPYPRTSHNAPSDEIARVLGESLRDWGRGVNLQRMVLPAAWLDFITLAPNLDWGRAWKPTSPFGVAHEGDDSPMSFAATGELEELGHSTSTTEYRFKSIRQLGPSFPWAPSARRPLFFSDRNGLRRKRNTTIPRPNDTSADTCGDSHDAVRNHGGY